VKTSSLPAIQALPRLAAASTLALIGALRADAVEPRFEAFKASATPGQLYTFLCTRYSVCFPHE
jgi:hypothetical protein